MKAIRLSKAAKELNVGTHSIVDFLAEKGIEIKDNPNTKIDAEAHSLLIAKFSDDMALKAKAEEVTIGHREAVTLSVEEEKRDRQKTKKGVPPQPEKEVIRSEGSKTKLKVKRKIDLPQKPSKTKEKEKIEEKIEEKETPPSPIDEKEEKQTPPVEEKKEETKSGLKIIGKQTLPEPKEKKSQSGKGRKKKSATKSKAPKEVKPEAETKVTETKPQPEEPKQEPVTEPTAKEPEKVEIFRKTDIEKSELKEVGKIDLSTINSKVRPDKKSAAEKKADAAKKAEEKKKRKRKRIVKEKVDLNKPQPSPPDKIAGQENASSKQGGKAGGRDRGRKKKKGRYEKDVDKEEVEKQMRETLAMMGDRSKSKGAKHRREKREDLRQKQEEQDAIQEAEKSILKLTEFITANDLATMMNMSVNEIIATCMTIGLFISINQRLDADTIELVAQNFGYEVQFIDAREEEVIEEDEEDESLLQDRPPIVTVMGHVDHGKTSLLDYIRKESVIAGEAGGITQHIGAYNVSLPNGKQIAFLDTPGHEAFTAMRARGTKVTDIAIIVIAADDKIMPQTEEAINHAKAAGLPIVFAINKIDKPGANPDKIKEELSSKNMLVEEWGGEYQSHDISAKVGTGVEELLEKVLIQAELLELKANPDKKAVGAVIDSSLDKGRGYVSTMLVQAGTLKIGDIMLAGRYYGKVKAMFNERNKQVKAATPSVPVLVLGLNGAPNAGDNFRIMNSDAEAREIATKRQQIQREQGRKTQKHLTLDEIGRRIAVGNFQQLNLIVKGDVDGSIEALSDSLLKLSNDEIQINVVHKAVGQISESDVMLASASDAIIIGFHVRPSVDARQLAEKEEIDIRLYSIIYEAIDEMKAAMEGMLSPEMKEELIGTVEVLETFKISKVGTIAGCMVRSGKIIRDAKVKIIREGIEIYTGSLGTLKRFKDDVKEVAKGYECGLNITGYNDIKVGDIIEAISEKEVGRKL